MFEDPFLFGRKVDPGFLAKTEISYCCVEAINIEALADLNGPYI